MHFSVKFSKIAWKNQKNPSFQPKKAIFSAFFLKFWAQKCSIFMLQFSQKYRFLPFFFLEISDFYSNFYTKISKLHGKSEKIDFFGFWAQKCSKNSIFNHFSEFSDFLIVIFNKKPEKSSFQSFFKFWAQKMLKKFNFFSRISRTYSTSDSRMNRRIRVGINIRPNRWRHRCIQ